MLSRTESLALRGFAMLAIMFHNYCHWLPGIVDGSEHSFHLEFTQRLWQEILTADAQLPLHLASFFGHFGIFVFIFLSGMGLAVKYDAQPVKRGRFVWEHYKKLFPLMFVGYALFIAVVLLYRHEMPYTKGQIPFSADEVPFHICNIVPQLLMIGNLLGKPSWIYPGPFWWFGLMLQLYALYAFCLHRASCKKLLWAVILCWIPQAILDPALGFVGWLSGYMALAPELIEFLRYNIFIGVMPFVLGILFARLPKIGALELMNRWHWAGVALLSTALLWACSWTFQTWLWSAVFVIVSSVAIVKSLPQCGVAVLCWFGAISAALFVSHCTARVLFIAQYAQLDVYAGVIGYLLVSVFLAQCVIVLMRTMSQKPA